MPFTFSHPALVVPFLRARRRWPWLSATGLITGSMAPDFEKFFRLHLASKYSHTVASIFYFSCPVSLALAFLFHGVVRRPLLANLPIWLWQRVGHYARFDWPRHYRQHVGGVLLSIVLGAAGHLFWDCFTHPNRLMTTLMPGMATLVPLGRRTFALYQVSGLVNSLVGGGLVAWAVWRLPVRLAAPAPQPTTRWPYWGLAALVTAALLVPWSLVADTRWLNIGITAISASMAGVVVASACFRRKSPAPGRLR